MAKRPARSSADDAGAAAAPAQPKPRRQRATATPPSPAPDTITADSRVEGSENGENNSTGIASEAGDDAPLESMSMGSEPSEEDIRMRAYHRYLERGGGQGTDFEDWLEAERELKGQRN
jgi:Protein of unknown function (DUF2934)